MAGSLWLGSLNRHGLDRVLGNVDAAIGEMLRPSCLVPIRRSCHLLVRLQRAVRIELKLTIWLALRPIDLTVQLAQLSLLLRLVVRLIYRGLLSDECHLVKLFFPCHLFLVFLPDFIRFEFLIY